MSFFYSETPTGSRFKLSFGWSDLIQSHNYYKIVIKTGKKKEKRKPKVQ